MASRADNLAPLPPLLSKAVTGLLWVGIAYMVVTQLAQQFLLYGGISGEILHLGGAVYVVALDFLRRKRSVPRQVFGGLSALAVVCLTSYFYVERDDIVMRSVLATTPDMIFTAVLLVVVFVFTYFTYGLVFPLIGGLAIAYTLWGHYLPDPFTGPEFTVRRIMARFSTGIFSGLITTANDFIWLLLFWGLLLEVSGAAIALIATARWVSRKMAGGPAVMTTISDFLVGGPLGAGPNSAAITGPITISAMKRAGYPAPLAAAIEAVASNGAAISPPILGTVAFIMADVLGITYLEVVAMSLMPFLLWYWAVGVYVLAHARREKSTISTASDLIPVDEHRPLVVVKSAVIGLVPMAILILSQVRGDTMRFSIFWALMALVGLALVLRIERRLSVWLKAVQHAVVFASGVTVLLGVVTIFADVLVFSGLQTRLGDIIEVISGGTLLWATIIMMLIGVLLASALPTIPIYYVMALTFGPILLRFGVSLEVSHFMAFYMGTLSFIIPPVAVSAMITAGIAGTSYWKVCREIVRMAFPLYFFPIVFVFAPELLLQGDSPQRTVGVIVVTTLALTVGQLGAVGWMLGGLRPWWRALAVLPFGLLLVGLITAHDTLLWASGGLATVMLLERALRRMRGLPTSVAPIGGLPPAATPGQKGI